MLRIVTLLLGVTMSAAQAQEGKGAIGPLDFSCGKWVSAPKGTPNHERLKQWVFGYLSGVNIETNGPDFLRGRDAD
jgi:hypothetical protein